MRNKPIWKLTAVTMSRGTKKFQGFLNCRMVDGKAILSRQQLNKIEKILGARVGDTITIG